MAKSYQGYMGPIIGKLGPSVGYLWRGRPVLRAYRADIRYPNTPHQQRERDWFVGMVRMAAAMRPALLLGLRDLSLDLGMTEGNLFVKRNKRCFALDGAVDYQHLALAAGPAANVAWQGAAVDADGVLEASYQPCEAGRGGRADDCVYLYIYNATLGEGILAQAAERRQKRLHLCLPDGWQSADLHLYGFTLDRMNRASNTAYVNVRRSEDLQQQPLEVLPLGVMDGDGMVHGMGQLPDDAHLATGVHGGGEDHRLEVVPRDGL